MRRALTVSLFIGILTVPLFPASPATAAPSCMGRTATVVGTSGRDRLEGTRRSDVIVGRGGKDLIIGKGGRDFICGGGDRDLIGGGGGSDRIRGDGGADDIFGLAGNDYLHGGKGRDAVLGGGGRDRLRGAAGVDVLNGGAQDDQLIDRVGNFQGFWGGAGDDYMAGNFLDMVFFNRAQGGIELDLAAGTATGRGSDRIDGIGSAVGTRHDDVFFGDASVNIFYGGGGDDVLNGRGNPATLETEETMHFADVLWGEGGSDQIVGGDGLTFASFRDGGAVIVDLNAGTARGQGRDVLNGVDAVMGSRHDDSLTGGAGDNLFVGARGNDVVDGGGGQDGIAFWFGMSNDGVTVDLAAGTATAACCEPDTFTSIESIFGSPGDDTLIGDDQANRIFGNQHADEIFGNGGDDYLDGGGGGDVIDGGDGNDTCLKYMDATNCESDSVSPAAAAVGDSSDMSIASLGSTRWRHRFESPVLSTKLAVLQARRSSL